MKKVLNMKKIIATVLLNLIFVFLINLRVEAATDPDLNITTTGSGEETNFFITVNGFQYASYVAAIPAVLDEFGVVVTPASPLSCEDSTDNPDDLISNRNPAEGFCEAINRCVSQPTLNCKQAIASSYNNKIIDSLQDALDIEITEANLDTTKANEALSSCGGDLACIENVLTALQGDTSFTNNKALISDLINSTNDNSTIFNTASNDSSGILGKNPSPQVNVLFSSNIGIQSGSKVKAVASPGYFNNGSDLKDLYFTWYLKRDGCGLGNEATTRCDLDSDGEITVNDWKIAAAKIIISKSFDKEGVDYDNFSNGQDSEEAGYVAVPEIDKQKGSVDIGWRNGFMRDGDGDLYENNGASKDVFNCYVQASKSGRAYELREVVYNFNNQCPNGYHRACVSNQNATCGVYNSTNPNYSENFNACAVVSERSDNEDVFCGIKNDTDLKNFKATVSCEAENSVSLCVKNDNTEPLLSLNTDFGNSSTGILGIIIGTKLGVNSGVDDSLNNKMCNAVAKSDFSHPGLFLSNTNPQLSSENEDCETLQSGIINGKKDSSGNVVIIGNSNLEARCNFERGVNLCKHLFPVMPKGIKTDDGRQAVVGDGEFNLAEKKFWGADPSSSSTSGKGKDEENAVGLGVDTFEWTFSAGDQVGVVVEGESAFPTDHQDSSYKRMWAFSKGTCEAIDNMEKANTIDANNPDKNKRGFYIEGNNGILTAELDLNDCLEENLLDPTENDATEGRSKLTVQMSSLPKNPINDPNGKGDTLIIPTVSFNTQDYNNLLYRWTIQISRDGSIYPSDTTEWKDITNQLKKTTAVSANDLEGIDKRKLAIKLNLSEDLIEDNVTGKFDDTFYLKIKVRVNGTASDGNQSTDGFVIVKVRQQQNKMSVFPVTANNEGVLTMDNSTEGEFCFSEEEKKKCYVTKNEIIGLEVPNVDKKLTNFSWKVNGVSISCDSESSSQCSVGGNRMFVPILGNEGEAINVTATAINTETNEAVEVSRYFVIIKPQVKIVSSNESSVWPKLLGYYKDLNENRYPDYSDFVFETQEEGVATLSARFYPASIEKQTTFDWLIDGEIKYDLSNQKEITFPIDKFEGDIYVVGLSARHGLGPDNQANNLRKALLKNWNVLPQDSIEQEQNTNIQINVLAGSAVGLNRDVQKGLASLISYLPENLMFLLRIVLTSGGILLLTGVIFTVIPGQSLKKE
ncbi:MAG: hypothetical protein HGA61_04415 [Candidatus Moranbacteria bacterium]|nr:hypothetical protein [Candidatus Moranbacteria bacterium]